MVQSPQNLGLTQTHRKKNTIYYCVSVARLLQLLMKLVTLLDFQVHWRSFPPRSLWPPRPVCAPLDSAAMAEAKIRPKEFLEGAPEPISIGV